MFEDDELRGAGASRALLNAALEARPTAAARPTTAARPVAATPSFARPAARVDEATALVDDTIDRLRAAPALSLRIARLLAWLSTADLTPLGYARYSDFCAEHLEWGDTWARSLVKLVRSPLHQIKSAVCMGRVPITVAAVAPGTVQPDEQADWIAWVDGGGRPTPERPFSPARATIELHGRDTRHIHAARSRARLLIGRAVSDDIADAFILRAWRHRTPGRSLVGAALADPPVPDTTPPPPWPALADPATALLGPYRPPSDVHQALAELQRVQRLTRARTVAIGRALRRITDDELYRDLGYHSLRALVSDRFPVGIRALEKHRRLGDDLALFPELQSAFDAGMDLGRITAVARIATEDDVDRWLDLARATSLPELDRAVRFAARAISADVLDAYGATVARLAAEGRWHANDTVALRAVWVSERAPRHLTVDADLPEAARWFLSNVTIPRQRGIGRVKERDHYTCQNPECHHFGLRVQAHHITWVSRGGSDDPSNLITVCKPCHLRLIHAGHVQVEADGDWLLWRYPGRRVWVQGVQSTGMAGRPT